MRGASEGEGLGNKFLANIRETDAIVHVVRAHGDENVVHPEGRVDPRADIDTIETELTLRRPRAGRAAARARDQGGARRRQGRRVAEEAWLRELIAALQAGRPARTVPRPEDAPNALRDLQPLTAKPVLFVANVDEGYDAVPAEVAAHAEAHGAQAVAVSSRIEAELSELDDDEAAAMRAELGIAESRPAARRARRLRAARPDRLLHGRRGQAGAVVASAERADRLARRRPDPLGHPERLRARRGDRLGGAASTPAATPARASAAR